jgi:hypothetical protein
MINRIVEPCPFCDGTSIFCCDDEGSIVGVRKYMLCASCGARGPLCKSEWVAVWRWNANYEDYQSLIMIDHDSIIAERNRRNKDLQD